MSMFTVTPNSRRVSHALSLLVIAAVTISLGSWGLMRFGSISNALAYVRGDRLIVDSASKSFGEATDGDRLIVEFAVTNISGRDVTLLGARSTCTCAVAGGLPLTIPAASTRPLRVTVVPRSRPEGFLAQSEVYTDHSEQPILILTIKGVVRRVSGPLTDIPRGRPRG